MKNSKNIFIFILSFVIIVVSAIPIYAYSPIPATVPSDIGDEVASYNNLPNGFYYLKITINDASYNGNLFTINYNFIDNSASYNDIYTFSFNNQRFLLTENNSRDYVLLYPLYYSYLENDVYRYSYRSSIQIYYFPICIAHREDYVNLTMLFTDNEYFDYKLYTIDNYAFDYDMVYYQGYVEGYDVGIIDGAEFRQDLNLVEHCEQLLGTFVGDDYAHYITPLCLALVVILIYFLFIRWLLALVKSKNVTRVADIIVCTACIIMLVIMYAPMLQLSITQNQIVQHVYSVVADTVVGG